MLWSTYTEPRAKRGRLGISDSLRNVHYLEEVKILPEEQKGCKRGSCGTKDQLLIGKTVLKDCKKRHTNLSMAWIDYRLH